MGTAIEKACYAKYSTKEEQAACIAGVAGAGKRESVMMAKEGDNASIAHTNTEVASIAAAGCASKYTSEEEIAACIAGGIAASKSEFTVLTTGKKDSDEPAVTEVKQNPAKESIPAPKTEEKSPKTPSETPSGEF